MCDTQEQLELSTEEEPYLSAACIPKVSCIRGLPLSSLSSSKEIHWICCAPECHLSTPNTFSLAACLVCAFFQVYRAILHKVAVHAEWMFSYIIVDKAYSILLLSSSYASLFPSPHCHSSFMFSDVLSLSLFLPSPTRSQYNETAQCIKIISSNGSWLVLNCFTP